MRIRNIDNLEDNINTKVLYLVKYKPYDAYEDEMLSTIELLRQYRIIPCSLHKNVDKNLCGYRMIDKKGSSFECEHSTIYTLEGLSEKQCKKYDVDKSFFDWNRVTVIKKDYSINCFEYYENLTMYDGIKYNSYTADRIETEEEFSRFMEDYTNSENNHIHFEIFNKYALFTDFYEAFEFVKYNINSVVTGYINEINKSSEIEKKSYYDILYRISNNNISLTL